jgi:hypothetical protein
VKSRAGRSGGGVDGGAALTRAAKDRAMPPQNHEDGFGHSDGCEALSTR